MWLHSCLKEIQGFRSLGVRGDFLTTGIMQLGHFAHKRDDISQELH